MSLVSLPLSTSTAAVQLTRSTDEIDAAQLGDACRLLALFVRTQTVSQAGSKTDVALDYDKLEALKKKLAEALEQAKEAADHSGFFGFLSNVFGSDIAKIAGAVAAVAAVVATGGAAAPVLLMAASLALEEGAKLGAQLGLDPKICMAISLCAVAVGLMSGTGTTQAAGTLAQVARDVKLGAQLTETSATATGAGLGYVSSKYEQTQLEHQADATGYQAQSDATNADFDSALALLQESLRTEQRETVTTSAIIQNGSDTNATLADRI